LIDSLINPPGSVIVKISILTLAQGGNNIEVLNAAIKKVIPSTKSRKSFALIMK